MRSAKTKGAPNCVWLQSFRFLCINIQIMWLLQNRGVIKPDVATVNQLIDLSTCQRMRAPNLLQNDENPKPNRLLRTSVSQPSLCESNGDESQQSSQTMANVKAITWGVCLDDNRLEDDKKSIQRGLRQTRCTQRREGSEEIRLRAHKPVFAQIGTDKRASIHAWVWPVKVNTPSNLISRYRRRKVLCHGSLFSPMWSLVHQCKSEP